MEIADGHVRRTFLPDIPNPKLTGPAEGRKKKSDPHQFDAGSGQRRAPLQLRMVLVEFVSPHVS